MFFKALVLVTLPPTECSTLHCFTQHGIVDFLPSVSLMYVNRSLIMIFICISKITNKISYLYIFYCPFGFPLLWNTYPSPLRMFVWGCLVFLYCLVEVPYASRIPELFGYRCCIIYILCFVFSFSLWHLLFLILLSLFF